MSGSWDRRQVRAFLVVVLSLVLVTSLTGSLAALAAAGRYNVVVATGGIGGVYYYYGTAVAELISRYANLSGTAIQTAASIDDLLLIRDRTDLARGTVYCATVLPDSAYLAYTSRHERFASKPAPISILWAMYPNHLHIVTADDTGIKSLSDLKGKRVSTGAPGSGTEVEALLVLEVAGVDPARDFAKWERLGASESAQALADGSISAYFWSGGLPTASVVELGTTLSRRSRHLRLVPVPDDLARQFAVRFPGLAAPARVDASVYGTREATPTLAFWNMFVCHKDTPEEVTYAITKAVFEHLDELVRAVPPARDTTVANAAMYLGGTIPYSEGALRYFREIGAVKK
ncbi:TAXI family TRAP transporter solute-binding subunit [Carboxydochorda subterranea]|uniref:TAXI family TRAP transporter solute-binding subunit n=1 Tax=Carboxydichorda subterranea TaxID=3109565 RepID=A0ABZ1C0Z6_9FIRM|nr:TAXI family TRAP transporter solute-binding subunit [Limnochorda sp. L945t]WRP18760.1 TAXI family TRAP transporter solute-binding subunit [Limnochorda sp. L945t]